MAKRTYQPHELLRLAEMLDVVGVSRRTMARRMAKGDVGVPPFVKINNQRRWRYDHLIAFRDKDTSLTGLVEGYPDLLNSKTEDKTSVWTVENVTKVVGEWKERELWLRAREVMSGAAFEPEPTRQFESERNFVDPGRRNKADADWVRDMIFGSADIARQLGFKLDHPPSSGEEMEARNILKHLLIFTYSEIVASEAKWREMDWHGMPKSPPSTLS